MSKSLSFITGIALFTVLFWGSFTSCNPFSKKEDILLHTIQNLSTTLEMSCSRSKEKNEGLSFIMKGSIRDEILNENKRINEGLNDTLDIILQKQDELIGLIDQQILSLQKETEDKKNASSINTQELVDSTHSYYAFTVKLYNSQLVDKAKSINKREIHIGSFENEQDWFEKSFSTSPIASISTLQALKLEIYDETYQLLGLLNTRLNPIHMGPDRIITLSAPLSTVVQAGEPFICTLYTVVSSSLLNPIYESSSGSLVPKPGYRAELHIQSDPNVIPIGKTEGTQVYSYSVKIPKATGGYETISQQASFTVRRPCQ